MAFKSVISNLYFKQSHVIANFLEFFIPAEEYLVFENADGK